MSSTRERKPTSNRNFNRFKSSFIKFAPMLFVLIMVVASLFTKDARAAIQEKPIGTVYEINEVSLLQVIMNRLHHLKDTGEMDQMQEEFKNRVLNTIQNPPGVTLPRATELVSRYFDPSITFNQDVLLPDGQVLHPAGTSINPLKIRSLTKRLIFIDQRDQDQVGWAYQKYQESLWRDKVILVAGSYVELTKQWKKPVYFDQLGVGASAQDMPGEIKRETMVKRFGISSLPAIVYQEGMYLRIDEVPM